MSAPAIASETNASLAVEAASQLSLAQQLSTFQALLERDAKVAFRNMAQFVVRVAMQPALFAFVFAYVFPRIGEGIGGTKSPSSFASILLPGLVATTLIFQGIFTVALPLVTEFSVSKEIEDRVMAPVPTSIVAVEKIVAGAFQCLLAGLLVIPIVWVASGFDIHIDWSHPLELVSLLILGAFLGASLGLTLGTVVAPQQITLIFSLLVLPLTLLGAVYYPWSSLSALRWLQILVLSNPVVYLSEGMRAGLTPDIDHLPLIAVYGLVTGATLVLAWIGINGFKRRVLS